MLRQRSSLEPEQKSRSYMSASTSPRRFSVTRFKPQISAAQSGRSSMRSMQRSSTSGSGHTWLSEKNNSSPRASSAASVTCLTSWRAVVMIRRSFFPSRRRMASSRRAGASRGATTITSYRSRSTVCSPHHARSDRSARSRWSSSGISTDTSVDSCERRSWACGASTRALSTEVMLRAPFRRPRRRSSR